MEKKTGNKYFANLDPYFNDVKYVTDSIVVTTAAIHIGIGMAEGLAEAFLDPMQIDFDGGEAEHLEQEFREELNKRHAVGGTYYPPPESMINALNVLRYYFFDGMPEIQVEGGIGEIPGEKDMIY